MTLGRLLFGGLALIFLLVLAGVETIHVRHTQRSLQLQLNAQANETATALALTLGSLLNTPDEVMAKTIITPVFDRGYYRSIRLLDMDGANLVGRARTPEANAVPNWFRQVFHVEEPVGQALVSSGWKQMGRVLVQPHPEFAYQQLWGTATATLAWLAGLFAMALFAATYFLKGILRPLEAVEAAAVAIGERRFLDVHVAAPTREVGRVVKAMNTLSGKLREAMQHEEARAARLLRDAYEDTTTGTLNERGFAQRVTALLAEEGRTGHGAMIMLSVARLEEVNRAEGLAAGDMLLAALGASLSKLCAPLGALAGHDRGASFLAFLPHCERDEAKAWVGRALELADTRTPCTAGIAWFEGAAQFEQLLDLARIAHTQARQRGESLRLLDMASGVAGSAEQWRARIESACVEGRIELHGQDAVALSDGRRLHVEITSRLIGGEGIDMPAALFVPMASRHGMLPRLDIEVLKRVARLLTRGAVQREQLALNVSAASLRDAAYLQAVRALLKDPDIDTQRMVFEINAQGATGDSQIGADFAALLAGSGASLALDDLELSSGALLLARQLLPAYVKLAPSATRNLSTQSEARYLVESVVALLRPLEIQVFAKGVENQADIAVLGACGVSGIQGYAISRPVALEI